MDTSIDLIAPTCAAQSIGAANSAVTSLLQFLVGAFCTIANTPWPKDDGQIFLEADNNVYDFIIVGAGTAGSVIAGRLSENPNYKILLIEAGDDPPIESEIPGLATRIFGTAFDWNYATKSNNKSCLGFPGGGCPWPRGKMLGGSSAINGMIYIRGHRGDFDHWAELGNPTWSWDDVLPYFRKTENYKFSNPYNEYGNNGPLSVNRFSDFPEVKEMIMQSAQEAGYTRVDDFREGHYLGYGYLNALLIGKQRETPAKAFLNNHRPNLHIIKNAVVTKINFGKRKRATSVNFQHTDKSGRISNLVAKVRKEVIVSAGAVESPKLLMLSGIGPKEHLNSLKIPVLSNLAVGRNLQDHTLVGLYFTYSGPAEDPLNNTFNYLAHGTGRLSGIHAIDLAGFLDIKNTSGIYPNMEIHHNWIAQGSFPNLVGTNPGVTHILRDAYEKSGIFAMQMVLLNPHSLGHIELNSNDYRQQPLIDPNYLSDYRDVQLYIDTINTLLNFQHTPTFQREKIKFLRMDLPECRSYKYPSDKYWECYIRHTSYILYHPVGTVKMGPSDDPEAVVDHKLRVRGVKGLRVADASIMPKIVSANTMAATIMIGEKAADFIKSDWSKRGGKKCRG